MNQTRTFLILAWLMVAMLLWWEWGKESAEMILLLWMQKIFQEMLLLVKL